MSQHHIYSKHCQEKLARIFRVLAWVTLVLAVAGCGGRFANLKKAPVVAGWHTRTAARRPSNYYKVQPGDTLYSIAWAFDMDFRTLARINHLRSPYKVDKGQRLLMTTRSSNGAIQVPKTVYRTNGGEKKCWRTETRNEVPVINGLEGSARLVKAKRSPRYRPKPLGKMSRKWIRPAQGRIVASFSSRRRGGNKGIDIRGKFASPIVASNNGRVVYCGTGIRSYGRLIIIKHSNSYLSAYGHNKKLLVKEGDMVKKGQKIALMGRNDAGKIMLHFEIRRNGKPINPRRFI